MASKPRTGSPERGSRSELSPLSWSAGTTAETTAAAKPAKAKKERAAKADCKLSQLDAAVKALLESKEPTTTKEMVEARAAKEYWSIPGGKTPAATLYSAIIRELQKKGDEAQFEKVERGCSASKSRVHLRPITTYVLTCGAFSRLGSVPIHYRIAANKLHPATMPADLEFETLMWIIFHPFVTTIQLA